MAQAFPNYIKGQWEDMADHPTFEQRNPANLDEVTGVWPVATRGDAQRAIEAAQEAFGPWSRLTVQKRAAILKVAHEGMKRRRDEFAEILTRENGKTLTESQTEIDSAILEMEFQIHEGVRLYGQTAPSSMDGVFAYSTRQALGVVAIISPWNFPFNVPGRKMTPALMAGNTCVFKPASLTPQTGLKFVELFAQAGLPAGVLNFITGGGDTLGHELVTHSLVKAISFTGSTQVGRQIHQQAARNMTRTQLEMGGKNPAVVLEDADLAQAAEAVVKAAFACAGQWCTSTSRVIVARGVAETFRKQVLELTRQIKVGKGTDPAVTMGPVCGRQQLESILEYLRIGKEEGATLLCGGERMTGGEYGEGCFVAPTLFADVQPEMKIAQEEIFGPVLSIMEVSDFAQALAWANQVDFGLSSSIFTSDLQKAFTFLEETEVGLAHVNLMTAVKEPHLGFGGIKASGMGLPEAGRTGIEFFTEHKVAYVKYR